MRHYMPMLTPLFSLFMVIMISACSNALSDSVDELPVEPEISAPPGIDNSSDPLDDAQKTPEFEWTTEPEQQQKPEPPLEEPAPPHQEPEISPPSNEGDTVQAVAEPASVTVMVNKNYRLPENYSPSELVEPNVRFLRDGVNENRSLRPEAATALEEMFAAAEEDGLYLAAVSGYRSEATQTRVFNYYVARDGEEKANQYSARPGHSEHQTGLAMDVSGSNGYCAIQNCFADTEEAAWLATNAHEFGYIVRYLKGKEHITGYQYEPWHLRYVGMELATELVEAGVTLEEYFDEADPVFADPES